VLRLSDDGARTGVAWHGRDSAVFTPTSELPSPPRHPRRLAAARRPPRAIVHSHPTELLALSLDPDIGDEGRCNRLLWALHPETVIGRPLRVAIVPYVMPGTVEQGMAAGGAMETHDVALWRKHGAVGGGRGLRAAFDLLDSVNKAAQLYLLCRSAGIVPAVSATPRWRSCGARYGPRRPASVPPLHGGGRTTAPLHHVHSDRTGQAVHFGARAVHTSARVPSTPD